MTLEIAPHPGLTAAQARAIAIDYGLRHGSTRIPVRRALLGLDAAALQEQHIVLVNRDEVAAVLASGPET